MASAGVKKPAVGSSEWVQTERALAGQYIGEATDDFECSIRNELEWLDAHMKDIFSKNQVYALTSRMICSVHDANPRTGTLQTYSKHRESCAAKHPERHVSKAQEVSGSRLPTSSRPISPLHLQHRKRHSLTRLRTSRSLKMSRISHHTTDPPAEAKAHSGSVNRSTGTRATTA